MRYYVLITGGRNFMDYKKFSVELDRIIKGLGTDTEIVIVNGKAKGADYLASVYATHRDYEVEEFEAEWTNFDAEPCVIRNKGAYRYNAVAGNNRNTKMLKFLLEQENRKVVAFWDYESTGTKDMINKARDAGVDVEVIKI